MPRDNFSPTIKNALALRAGYLCSMCKKLTVGPSEESKISVSKTGTAAHIYGAARGHLSRRQDDSISSEFRSSVENGIWLCNNHATLIDRDEDTYTARQLLNIKKKHEEYVKFMNGGINVRLGLITKIKVENLPFANSSIDLNLGEKNLLFGNNGVGKTMICELIASMKDKKHLDRWKRRINPANAFFEISYFKEEEDKYLLLLDRKGHTKYSFNDIAVPFLRPPLYILFLSENINRFRNRVDPEETKNFLEILAEYFSLSIDELHSIINSMREKKKIYTTDIFIENEDLKVRLGKREGDFESFSGGEKDRIMLDIIFTIAEFNSKFSSTILLLEQTAVSVMDSAGIEHFLEKLRHANIPFQMILTLLPPMNRKYNLEGYVAYQLTGSREKGIAANQL